MKTSARPLGVIGVGAYVPAHRVSNPEIEARLGVEAGWIQRRTGVVQRPIAEQEDATSDLAIRAAEAALKDASIGAEEIGFMVLATSTPDHLLPPSAPVVATALGMRPSVGAIDLAGACAGFCYALILAESFGRTSGTRVLVIAANTLSRRTDPLDRSTASVFADGAGAVVLGPVPQGRGITGSALGADGTLADAILVPAGGSRVPITAEGIAAGDHQMRMPRGPAMFHEGVRAMASRGQEALDQAGWSIQDVDLWVPHQAGSRLIAESGKLLGIPAERTMQVVDHIGNSSAATIPIALEEAATTGRLREGDRVLLTAVGAGIVSGAVALRW